MEKRSSVTSLQLALMTGGNAIIVAYTFIPLSNTDLAGINSVYTLLLSLAYILILNTPVLLLMLKFRNATVNQMLEIITGKVIGKILAGLLALFFLANFTVILSISIYYIKSYLLPLTPLWALVLITLAPVVYTALKGSGTAARMATVIIPLVLVTIAVFFIAGLDKMNWGDIASLVGCSDFAAMNKYAFFSASRYSEILLMNMFCRNLMQKASITKTYILSFVIYVVAVAFIVMPTLLTLGLPFSKLQLNPYFIYCRQVGSQGIFQKLQSVNIYFWYLGILYKLAVYLYMSGSLTAGIFKKFSLKAVTGVISGVMLIVSNIGVLYNVAVINAFAKTMAVPVMISAVVFAVPVILIGIALIRKKHVCSAIADINEKAEIDEKEENDFVLPKGEELFTNSSL